MLIIHYFFFKYTRWSIVSLVAMNKIKFSNIQLNPTETFKKIAIIFVMANSIKTLI